MGEETSGITIGTYVHVMEAKRNTLDFFDSNILAGFTEAEARALVMGSIHATPTFIPIVNLWLDEHIVSKITNIDLGDSRGKE